MYKEQQLEADIFLHHKLQQHTTLDRNSNLMQISFTTIGCNNTPHWTATPLLYKHEPITQIKLIFIIIGNPVEN
jgi:hypothetical protein